MKLLKRLFLTALLLAIAAGGAAVWILYGSKTSNPHNYATIGDIPAPLGFRRIPGDDARYSDYLRSLPLKSRGSRVQLYTGGDARFQSLNYAVVDLPIIYLMVDIKVK